MLFNNTSVYNFQQSLHGMRNPKNSWDKSDSLFGFCDRKELQNNIEIVSQRWAEAYPTDNKSLAIDRYNWQLEDNGIIRYDKENNMLVEYALIGPNDMKLAQNLVNAGPEHRKFLRQIFVSVDITAPLFWWKQMQTYKVATVSNSTSTMHTLTSSPITIKNFETNDFDPSLIYYEMKDNETGEVLAQNDVGMLSDIIIEQLEFLRLKYLETKDKKYWKELIRWLPESWLQTRTFTCNYETLHSICFQRRNHKLNEWSGKDYPTHANFIAWSRKLPYSQQLIFNDENIPFQFEN